MHERLLLRRERGAAVPDEVRLGDDLRAVDALHGERGIRVLDRGGIRRDRHADAGRRPTQRGGNVVVLADDVGDKALTAAGVGEKIVVPPVDDDGGVLQTGERHDLRIVGGEEVRLADGGKVVLAALAERVSRMGREL